MIPGVDYNPATELLVTPGDAGDPYWNAACSGCTDATADNYDATATIDDGTCTYAVPGCTDASACNYDAAATADDGSCTYAAAGYDCSGACLSGEEVTLNLYDSFGDGWTRVIHRRTYRDVACEGGRRSHYFRWRAL